MDEKQVVYKIKYEIEIEIAITEQNKKYTHLSEIIPYINVTTKPLIRNFERKDEKTSEICDYIEQHFPKEIMELYQRMHMFEGLVLLIKQGETRSKIRRGVASHIKREVDKDFRKRLITPRGAIPKRDKDNFYKEKEQFISDCVELLKKMKNEQIPLNQQNFADRYFTDKYRDNQVKPLLEKLKLYGISWKKLKAKITQ